MIESFLNLESNRFRCKAILGDEEIQMPAMQGVVLVSAVDGGAVVTQKPQIIIAQFIVGKVFQEFFK